ncbi:hypothetical protein A2125_01710 [Candidatus Woesebacteria bacterium GWB1_43_5]|uniref:General secretion pathway GspH domain-containing protein n=1 Tax=Candidatus Woesebacteria bacterium GWB1_43_5 TaxID=1802474 RepID=A0A1F7WQX0_9BACT|nr:MAG: hypothetical protein A2125_01710 [Candidatus Woesebacteria bacterium GWB1_43_5]
MSNVQFPIANFRRGYTLVEILVSITIISIVFGAGYVAFREFARRQTLVSAVRGFTADLRVAQSQALAGKKPEKPECDLPYELTGYNFEITSSSSYKVEAKCTGGTVLIKNSNVPAEVSVSAGTANPILFKILGGGTNVVGVSTITLSAYGQSQQITVGTGGIIE